jgi:intracellular multiplication protein IcmG
MLVPSGGGEMKTVAVGDTLSGIGRIKSIQMEGGRWVVQGTTGKVTN